LLECISIASVPALQYASALLIASPIPQPAIKASTLAIIEKSLSSCMSLPAFIFPQNSSISANFW